VTRHSVLAVTCCFTTRLPLIRRCPFNPVL
jgi:hypothetical protein